jgi:hypothetical protein
MLKNKCNTLARLCGYRTHAAFVAACHQALYEVQCSALRMQTLTALKVWIAAVSICPAEKSFTIEQRIFFFFAGEWRTGS